MTQLQAIRNFASKVAGTHVTIARSRDDWAMDLSDLRHPRIFLPQDLNQYDTDDKLFRAFFIERCPLAQGFANVTISILHELGHWFNPIEYLISDVDAYNSALGVDHFFLPCELIATDWAVEWLQDKAHRKMAKAFERIYFGHA